MKRVSSLWGSVLIACALAAPAAAQTGGGLYEPFPDATSRQEARHFLDQAGGRAALLGEVLTDAGLDGGTVVDERLRVPEPGGAASLRAGQPGDSGPLPVAGYLAAFVLLLASGGLVAARRRA